MDDFTKECLAIEVDTSLPGYLSEASGRRSSTLFSDEADGAFDAQHKRQFMAMKREMLRIGGYAQEYFISHTPELSAMADAIIDLDQYLMGDHARQLKGSVGSASGVVGDRCAGRRFAVLLGASVTRGTGPAYQRSLGTPWRPVAL